VLVVAGRNFEGLRSVVEANGALLAVNPQPETGQFSSLQAGLREVRAHGCDVAIVALVDRPPVLPQTMALLRRSFEQAAEEIWAVYPEFAGRHGHPVIFGSNMIAALLSAPADSTAREVQQQHREHISRISVDDPLAIANIDTPAEYEELDARGSRKR
jgi:molybdenum cofactor cytidylyltransferase